MSFVKQFHKQAFSQAVQKGIPAVEARAVASAAVFNRLKITEGYAIAESADFLPERVVELSFNVDSIQVDESEGGSSVVRGSLMTVGPTPMFINADGSQDGGWEWSEEALFKITEAINRNGLIGVIDGHKGWREGTRSQEDSVIESIKATYNEGRVWIETKLKKGFEWVAKKLTGLSIEARIPKDGVKGRKIIHADPVAFTFVEDGKQKRPENRVYSVTS